MVKNKIVWLIWPSTKIYNNLDRSAGIRVYKYGNSNPLSEILFQNSWPVIYMMKKHDISIKMILTLQ
jgi:hypothetical protein